jgi:serine/threonine protein kinase
MEQARRRAEGIGGFERLMAIKMIHPHLSKQQSFINMFLDEARIAALIRHPNVVPVYEIGEHFGRHFIAMDYVSGEPLSILLDNTWCRGIPLDFDVVAFIVSVVCEALHAAHDLTDPTGRPLKVVHRDVCPQNIMLGYDGITRVMDFGVAKAVDQLSQTRPGTHKGKVPYMAPEQIRCQPIDRRSDIFSLGVVLWESTIGKRLFKAENDILSASMVLKGKVPRPSRARDNFPLELEAIVLKALNPRPERRYQTAREMGQALREYLAHRASLVAPSDLETLLKTICKGRFERRMEMERRAATDALEAGPIEEDTINLFASGESNLPAFDVEAALKAEVPASALLSAVTARQVYEFEDEEIDDATVRTQLEEIGFVATQEYDLLDEDRDDDKDDRTNPDLDRNPTDDVPTTLKHDTSAVRELVAESNAAILRSSQDVISELLAEELSSPEHTPPPVDILPEFLSEPVSIEPRENTPLLKLDLIGGKRGVLIVGGALLTTALVALTIASGLEEETPAPVIPQKASLATEARTPPPPPVKPQPEVQKKVELPPVVEAPPPPPPPKVVKPEPPPPPPPVVVEAPPPPAPPPPIETEAVVQEDDPPDEPPAEPLARHTRPKKKKQRPEKKQTEKKQERILVGPDDL